MLALLSTTFEITNCDFEDMTDIKEKIETINFISQGEAKKSSITIAKPRVFIPTFPGTNCEYDLQRAFEKAGL